MVFKKYPYHNFAWWLKSKNQYRVAGTHSSLTDNVILKFLAESDLGINTNELRISCAYMFVPDVAPAELPRWAGRLLALLDMEKTEGTYQFRTVSRMLQIVKDEMKNAIY